MNFGALIIAEGVIVVVLLGAFFGFTTLIMDKAINNTNNMITGMMTGDVNLIESSVNETDSYMRSLGKTSTGFLDKIFMQSENATPDEHKILMQKAREKLAQMKQEFANASDIAELEEYLNQLE